MMKNHLDAFQWLHKTLGPTVSLRLAGQEYISVTQPEDIKQVMRSNYANYGKGAAYDELNPIIGSVNMLTSHGEAWVRQRRICGPEFHPKRVADYQPAIVEYTSRLIEAWKGAAQRNGKCDGFFDMKGLILRISCNVFFGIEAAEEVDQLGSMFEKISGTIVKRAFAGFKLPLWAPTPGLLLYKHRLRRFHDFVKKMIARQQAAGEKDNLLNRLLRARDSVDGKTMTPEEVHHHVVLFLTAAYETTAAALGWTFYFVGRAPEVQEKLTAESRQVLGGRAPTVDDIAKLKYTRQVLLESLRLFPPAPILARKALADDQLPTCPVKAGVNVTLPMNVVQNDAQLWRNPEAFQPERFADDAAYESFAYAPFAKGARECIGREFALQEMISVLAMVFGRFRFELEPGYVARPKMLINPPPADGVPLYPKLLAD
jgi:cytochrome P450